MDMPVEAWFEAIGVRRARRTYVDRPVEPEKLERPAGTALVEEPERAATGSSSQGATLAGGKANGPRKDAGSNTIR